MLFLHAFLPSCVHPLRGDVVVCGEGVHVRVAQISQTPHLCVPFWWLSLLFATFATLALMRAPCVIGAASGGVSAPNVDIMQQAL